MKPKPDTSPVMDVKVHTQTFILGEKVDDTKNPKRNEKDSKKEAKRLEKERAEKEKLEKKERERLEKEKKEREKDKDKKVKKGKTFCQACGKKCSGEVLRVTDKYFHMSCFVCRTCGNTLSHGGFFCKDGVYYCPQDYQKLFGTRCAACNTYVEGEVVSALGNTYHQKCFTCARCRQAFPSGEKVTYTGKEVLCQKCVMVPVKEIVRSEAVSPTASNPNECAGCNQELSEGQALVALDRQWHMWCFACRACKCVLHGEYMGRDGVPYCEKDYQRLYGVRCAYCQRFISGKVLQAGDNHHFHPTCARCTKCGDPFGDGEEMFLQGGAIWHPRCGPGPGLEGTIATNGHHTDSEADRASSVANSDMQFLMRSRTPSLNGSIYSPYSSLNRKQYGSYWSRVGSPGLVLREYGHGNSRGRTLEGPPHRILTYSYLTEQPAQGYLRRPIEPYDRPPTSPHFHRPHSSNSSRGDTLYSRSSSKNSHRPGMRVLVDSIRSETPRAKSPSMNNEEPIELAHYPAASKPPPGYKAKIDRDDFPAPPYPYTDPERRRRWSDSYKGVPVSDEENGEAVDGKVNGKAEVTDPQLKKEVQELSKIESGIAKVFLKNVKDREKVKQWKRANLDPRNASRTPSANKEPRYGLRYESPVGASPSRNLDHPRLFDDEDYSLAMDRASSYRGSVGRSVGQIPSYNVVHAAPRPGYSLKSSTLPATIRTNGCNGDFSFSGLGDKTHSTEFSSGKSDISGGSITDVDRSAMTAADIPVSSTFVGILRAGPPLPAHRPGGGGGGVRRSLPNMAHSHLVHEPAKIYPYHLLLISNYRLPHDVDRLNLERHLSDAEFEVILQCGRVEFYRLPQWRRNEIKRRAYLF